MTRSSLVRLPLALLATLALSACSSAPSWVQGDWHYDKARTEAAVQATQSSASSSNPGQGLLGSMMSGLAATIDSQLLGQLNGMEVIITGTDRIVTIGGEGKSDSYKTVKSSPDECVLKMKDNTVETYYRDGEDIYSYSSGTGPFKVYLKRQP